MAELPVNGLSVLKMPMAHQMSRTCLASQLSHARKVMTAEIMMSNFIAMHNLPFLAADHLSSLFSSMFPDSTIASDFSCKRTKTKSIICEVLDPYHKRPVVQNVLNSPFSVLIDESNEKGDYFI
jgi:hypothetical protein